MESTAQMGIGCGHRRRRGQRGGFQVTSFRAWVLPPEARGAAIRELFAPLSWAGLREVEESTVPCRLTGVRTIRDPLPHHQPVLCESQAHWGFHPTYYLARTSNLPTAPASGRTGTPRRGAAAVNSSAERRKDMIHRLEVRAQRDAVQYPDR
jgi:hypothetical protein